MPLASPAPAVGEEVATPAPRTEDPSAQMPPDPAPRAPKPVDEKVLGILREEAEFEAKARAREAEQLETQPELGLLASAEPWPMTSDQSTPDLAPVQEPQAKREQDTQPSFPDIEHISATLEPIRSARKSEDRNVDLPATPQERNRSFLRGLVIPIAIGVILIAVYVAAPEIAALVPALEPGLTAYVAAIDGLRISLVEMIGN